MDGGARRFRVLILLGSLAMIGSGFLPWWRAGGDSVAGVQVPAQEGIGLEGPGIIIFGAAIAALVLLDIGYMRGRWGFILDSPAVYLVLGLVAGAALAVPGLGAVVGRLPAVAAAVARPGAGRGRGGAGPVRRRIRLRRRAPLLIATRSGRRQDERREHQPGDDHRGEQDAQDDHRPQVGTVVARRAARRRRIRTSAQISPR